MLMSLGLFVFERKTLPFQTRDRSTAWRHAESERVGARPAVQFLGPGADEVTLAGLLIPEFAGSHAELARLRELADAGEALPLVDGIGQVWGDYIVQSIDDRGGELIDTGVPRRAEFTIKLKRVR